MGPLPVRPTGLDLGIRLPLQRNQDQRQDRLLHRHFSLPHPSHSFSQGPASGRSL